MEINLSLEEAVELAQTKHTMFIKPQPNLFDLLIDLIYLFIDCLFL